MSLILLNLYAGVPKAQIWIPDWSAIKSLILIQMLSCTYLNIYIYIHVQTSFIWNQNCMVSCQCLKSIIKINEWWMNLKNLVNKHSESIAYTMHVPVNPPPMLNHVLNYYNGMSLLHIVNWEHHWSISDHRQKPTVSLTSLT